VQAADSLCVSLMLHSLCLCVCTHYHCYTITLLHLQNGRLSLQLRNTTASLEHKLKQAEHKLLMRDKEHVDLQEAYKEKSRKCLAWEKAYTTLKHGGSSSGGANSGNTGQGRPSMQNNSGHLQQQQHDSGVNSFEQQRSASTAPAHGRYIILYTTFTSSV
jgi:hypothetical protein